jgi:hypothetical protein
VVTQREENNDLLNSEYRPTIGYEPSYMPSQEGGARSYRRAPYTHRSVQTHGPTRRVRHVRIRGQRGTKTQTVYHRGRRLYTVKKPLSDDECHHIRSGRFVPGLFRDCKKKGSMRRYRKK